jgi:hypothetical protein
MYKDAADTATRVFVSADTRKPWKDIFFDGNPDAALTEDKAGGLKMPLEALRLAPSASNKQPWRVIKDGNKLHIFLERTAGYWKAPREDIQLMDIGIGMCNFDIAAEEAGIKGVWKLDREQKAKEGWEGIAAWDKTFLNNKRGHKLGEFRRIFMAVLAAFVFTVFQPAIVHADYRSDMINGRKAYDEANLEEALKFYMDAYLKKPSPALGAFIKKLQKQVSDLAAVTAMTTQAMEYNPDDNLSKQENLVNISPLSFFLGGATLGFTRAFGRGMSMTLNFRYYWHVYLVGNYYDYASAISAGLDIDYYASKTALHGLFYGFGLGGIWINYRYAGETQVHTAAAFLPDLHFGNRWILGPGIEIDFKLGTAWPLLSYYRVELNTGYAF